MLLGLRGDITGKDCPPYKLTRIEFGSRQFSVFGSFPKFLDLASKGIGHCCFAVLHVGDGE